MAPSKSTAELEASVPHAQSSCDQCGEELAPGAQFCRACGTVRAQPHLAVADASPAADPEVQGDQCPACGAAVEVDSSFCRQCGAHLAEPPAAQEATSAKVRPAAAGRGPKCRSCGADLSAEQRFCRVCGTATAEARSVDRSGIARDPAWPLVVRGLTLIFEGSLTLVAASVTAAAVITLLSMFEPDGDTAEALRVGLLGAASLAALVGLGLMVWGDATNLWIPRTAKARVHALVVLVAGGVSTLLATLALLRIAWSGFEPAAFSAAGPLTVAALLVLLGRWVAFTTLLRRLAFALHHYRIAQGAIGFVVFTGVGLGVVGLIHLLFRTATEAAQTFAELLGLAFVVLVAMWALSLARRGRDLVRAQLS